VTQRSVDPVLRSAKLTRMTAGDDYEVAIVYSPRTSTTNKQKSDLITVKAISNDPKQQKPITVKLKGED